MKMNKEKRAEMIEAAISRTLDIEDTRAVNMSSVIQTIHQLNKRVDELESLLSDFYWYRQNFTDAMIAVQEAVDEWVTKLNIGPPRA